MRPIIAVLSWLAFAWGFVMPIPRRPHVPKPPEDPDHYFEGPDLTPAQREHVVAALRAYVRGGGETLRSDLIRMFETATRVDLPLPRSGVDWEAAEAEAARTGRSMADLIWDEAKMPDPIWYPRRRPRRDTGGHDEP